MKNNKHKTKYINHTCFFPQSWNIIYAMVVPANLESSANSAALALFFSSASLASLIALFWALMTFSFSSFFSRLAVLETPYRIPALSIVHLANLIKGDTFTGAGRAIV
uniref:Uncharacterized protein n=1 Tax=Cacopsylla melanoneura TaxID=428564 RepID=A0A8D9EK75_9HEMI